MSYNTSRIAPPIHRLASGAAVLLVNDIVESANYYRDRLGFAYGQFADDPPTFVVLHRDHCYLMLKQAVVRQHVIPYRQWYDQLWNVYFWVSNATSLYREYERRVAQIEYPLTLQPYGLLEFAVRDLDGYAIGFGQEVSASSPADQK